MPLMITIINKTFQKNEEEEYLKKEKILYFNVPKWQTEIANRRRKKIRREGEKTRRLRVPKEKYRTVYCFF